MRDTPTHFGVPLTRRPHDTHLAHRRSRLGLVGASLNVVSSQWASRESTIGPGSDSYYEYLLKVGLGGVEEGWRWVQAMRPVRCGRIG